MNFLREGDGEMNEQQQPYGVYMPYGGIARITAKQSHRHVPVVASNEPDRIRGVARRIGYTGKSDDDLAIYRLKVAVDGSSASTMLASLFVVNEGIFVEYEQWYRANKTTETTNGEPGEQTFQRN